MIRKGLSPVPKSLDDLKDIVLCAQVGTTGAAYIKDRVQPNKKALYPQTTVIMYQQLKSKRCDAALYDAPILGAQRFLEPKAYGPIIAQIVTNEQYGAAFQKGSTAPPRRQQGDQEAARQRHDRQAHEQVADVRRVEAARLQAVAPAQGVPERHTRPAESGDQPGLCGPQYAAPPLTGRQAA